MYGILRTERRQHGILQGHRCRLELKEYCDTRAEQGGSSGRPACMRLDGTTAGPGFPHGWGLGNMVPMLELKFCVFPQDPASGLSPPHPLSREHPFTIFTKLP